MKILYRLLLALKDAIVYRIRGGGFIQTGHDWIVRLIWGSDLVTTYAAIFWGHIDYFYAVAIIPLAYASMLVPHAYCMAMGRGAVPQKKWPSFFLPTLTNLQWTALPTAARTLYDFLSMAGVAAFRALIVFGPSLLSSYLQHGQIDPAGVLAASAVLIVGQPLAYLLGWYVPFSLGPSLEANSICWPEFFNGAVWTVAFMVML